MKFSKFLTSNSRPNGWTFCSMPITDMADVVGIGCGTCAKCIFEYNEIDNRAAIMGRFLQITIR